MSHDSAIASKEATGAPEEDIRITPIMIEAVSTLLWSFDYEKSGVDGPAICIIKEVLANLALSR